MAEQKFLSIITKDYLLKSFKIFNKSILTKKYFKKEEGENLENKLAKVIGEDENSSIRDIVKKLKKISKVFLLDGEKLPDANSKNADINSIYLYKDVDSINERNSYYIYTLREENNVKKWACISAPSYTYETEKIDFHNAFERAKKKFTEKVCFSTYLELVKFLKAKNQKMTYNGNSSTYYYDFLTSSFENCCCMYYESTAANMLYYFSKTSENIEPTEKAIHSYNLASQQLSATNIANTIQNPDGALRNGK